MLAPLERRRHQLEVRFWRGDDINHFDGRREQVVERARNSQAGGPRKSPCSVNVRIEDPLYVNSRMALKSFNVNRADPARAH